MRLATYNVEWFTNLFDEDATLLDDDGWSGRRDVTRAQQLAALGHVFAELDADGIMVIEAPDSNRRRSGVDALETFAAHFNLRQRRAIMGFVNDTQQEIAFLYDPDVLTVRHDPRDSAAPRFDGSFRIDLDIDASLDKVVWSKPPLELAVHRTDQPEAPPLHLIGVHAKSKAPHGARGAAAVMRTAIANRRKQLAQCIWLRRRAEEHLDAGTPLIILGDFNDGPGLDEYEALFGRSGVEVVIGEEGAVQMFDPHAAMAMLRLTVAAPSTARFFISHENRWLSALLDYIMVSPDLREPAPVWRIWHPFDDLACYASTELRQSLLRASDHFPVTVDLQI